MRDALFSSMLAGRGSKLLLRQALHLSLILVIAFGLGVEVSRAQSGPSRTPTSARTRERRVDEAKENGSDASGQGERTPADSGATVSGNNPAVNNGAAQAQTGQGARPDRIKSLRAQLANTPEGPQRTRLQRTLVDYLVALGQKDEAIKELRVMMRESRSNPVGLYNIGNALARLGDTDTAIDAYRTAIEQRRGNYSRALNNLGVLLLRQQRLDEAEKALTSAARLENNRYGEASYNLGRLFAARGQTQSAIREWAHALAVQPDHVDAALALARAYAASGDTERGVGVIDSFINRQGPSEALTQARREILSSKGAVETRKSLPVGQPSTPTTPPSDKDNNMATLP